MTQVVRKQRPMLSLGTGTVANTTGLKLVDDMEYDDWAAIARKLALFVNAPRWWVGDWVNYGEEAYGLKYQEALALTDLTYQAIADLAYVAGRIELSRRRESLSVAHHREVAPLSPEEQDRWLDRAEAEGWTRDNLRAAIQGQLEPVPPERTTVTLEQIRFTIPPERAERWKTAAEREGVAFSDWAARVLDEAAA